MAAWQASSSQSERDYLKEQEIHHLNQMAQVFQSLDFPATKSQVLRACGQVELLWTQTEPVTLVDAVRELKQTQFDTLGELMDAIQNSLRLAFMDRGITDERFILD